MEREYNLDLIITAPTVIYKIITIDGNELLIDSPAKMPDPVSIQEVQVGWYGLQVNIPTHAHIHTYCLYTFPFHIHLYIHAHTHRSR
ncbi:hypothetical protein EON63_16085 [archaeon]|nr:MAG: hypothetical protein EON63_16085 [archaeon]